MQQYSSSCRHAYPRLSYAEDVYIFRILVHLHQLLGTIIPILHVYALEQLASYSRT